MDIKQKRCLVSLVLLLGSVVLMALPLGAVLTFAPSPTERIERTFSYFDFGVFGMSGNPFPFLTALLAAAAVLVTLWNLLGKKESLKRRLAGWMLTLLGLGSSLAALLLLGTGNWVSIGISVLLFFAIFFQKPA